MGYVGNEPSVNFTSFAKQDITGDGGANYTLTYAVANANEIEVFVNNVRQEPSVAYTVSGTALTMTGNVASTDDFYVIYLGKALQTTTPPDGSVGTAKIADSAVDLTSKVTGVLPVANGGTGVSSEVPNITVTADYVDTTSGTSIDFTIPSGVKRITALMRGVGLSGTAIAMFRLGTSGGIVTSGYRGVSSNDAGNTYSYSAYGEGFLIDNSASASASDTRHGVFTFYLADATNGLWIGAGNTCRGSDGQGFNFVSSGKVGISGTCTTLRLTTSNGTDTFDGGSITILTE